MRMIKMMMITTLYHWVARWMMRKIDDDEGDTVHNTMRWVLPRVAIWHCIHVYDDYTDNQTDDDDDYDDNDDDNDDTIP